MNELIPRQEDNQASFPVDLLDGLETALVLFSAAFNGAQDAVWIHDAGLTATCIDSDREALRTMRLLYPDDWRFVNEDAFRFCEQTEGTWDVVTVDCPSQLFAECAHRVSLWCSRASRAVVLGTGVRTTVEAPVGWQVTDRRRRSRYDGGVYWTVLERTSDD